MFLIVAMVVASASASVTAVAVECQRVRETEPRVERLSSKRGGTSERVARTIGRQWWETTRREVGSSHVDRNGPTKFYPTIREARRGSGPRPTAATA